MKIKMGFILLSILVLLTSCSSNITSVLDGNQCQAPCWRNLTPGISTKEEVISALKMMKDINQTTIVESLVYNRPWEQAITWSFNDSNDEGGEIYLHDNKIVFMHFNINNRSNLSDVARLFGDPDQVWATKSVVDSVMLNIEVVYLNGICIDLHPNRFPYSNPEMINISKSTRVNSIYFFNGSLTPEKVYIACYWPIEENKIQKWKGYGKYLVFQE